MLRRILLLLTLNIAHSGGMLYSAAYIPAEAAGVRVVLFNNTNYTLNAEYQSRTGSVVKTIASKERVLLGFIENMRGNIIYNTSGLVRSMVAQGYSIPYQAVLDQALLATRRDDLNQEVVITISSSYTSYDFKIGLERSSSQLPISADLRRTLYTPIEMAEFGRKIYTALTSHNAQQFAAVKQQFINVFGMQLVDGALLEALVSYFYYIAHRLGHTFEEGTFVIYDQDSQLYAFLNRLEKKYARNATHFNGLAALEGKTWLAVTGNGHRGYDLELPSIGKRTILFNKLESDGSVFYLKPETHGTDQFLDLVGHATSFVHAQGRKLLPSMFGSDDRASYSKERIPKEVISRYLSIIEALPESEEEKTRLAKFAVARGIQSMYKESQRLVQKYPSNEGLRSFMQWLEAKSRLGDPKFSHLDKRFGAEVILTPEEFAKFKLPIPSYATF